MPSHYLRAKFQFCLTYRVALLKIVSNTVERMPSELDDLEYLRGRRLLFQRFTQIVGALPHLIEQSRVLDRNDRLGSEILDQLDLLVRKWIEPPGGR